jgi:hypothetical protein
MQPRVHPHPPLVPGPNSTLARITSRTMAGVQTFDSEEETKGQARFLQRGAAAQARIDLGQSRPLRMQFHGFSSIGASRSGMCLVFRCFVMKQHTGFQRLHHTNFLH